MAKKVEGLHEAPEKDVKNTKKTFKKFYFPEIGKTLEAETLAEATKNAKAEAEANKKAKNEIKK